MGSECLRVRNLNHQKRAGSKQGQDMALGQRTVGGRLVSLPQDLRLVTCGVAAITA